MRRFANPAVAIEYMAESEQTRPRNPNKCTYYELQRRTGIHHSTFWRILERANDPKWAGKPLASVHIAEKLQVAAEKEARRRKRAKEAK